MQTPQADLILRIAARFAGSRIRPYLAGGIVRDILLGRPSRDVDILLEAPAGEREECLRILAKLAGMDPVAFDRREPATYRVVASGVIVDASFCEPGGLAAALERRDFTINAMALPLPVEAGSRDALGARAARHAVIDPLSGAADLDRGRIAAAGPRALREDPLRMLRAIRLAATLDGFEIDPELAAEIRRRAPELAQPAAERISLEMEMILASPRPGRALRRMEELDLLSRVLPETAPMRGLAQPARYHDHDVLEHTLRAVEHAGALASGLPEAGMAPLGEEERLVLVWAALLHDAGKPATCTVGAEGVPHFYGHEAVSAEMAAAALRRLRVPSRISESVARLVSLHLRLGALAASRAGDRPLRRLLRASGEAFPPLALLALADRRAAGGTDGERLEADLLATIRRASMLREEVSEAANAPPLLRGEEVMRILGIEPGPRVGSILAWLDRLRTEGRISTRDEAESILRELPPPRIRD